MVGHKHVGRIGGFVGAVALCCLAAPSSALAQSTQLAQQTHRSESQVLPVVARRCTCGRWTCPACQQQKLQIICPPGTTIMPMAPGSLPGSPIAPGSPGMPGSEQAAPPSVNAPSDQQPTGEPSAADLNQPNPAALDDLRNTLAQSSSQRNFMGLNTGGIADPGMMGDFFGPTSNGASIISQNYIVNGYGTSVNGSPYDFEVSVAPPQTPPSIYDDVTASGPLSPAGVAPLGTPHPGTDLPHPTDPAYQWAGGNAYYIGNYYSGNSFAPPPPTGDGDIFRLEYGYAKSLIVPSSFSLQRMKIAENTSPIPQNRIFMNYSLFGNVPLTDRGISVNRLSPGFETLLFSPRTSFEMRTPFATTLDSDVLLDGGTNTNNVEFGNLFFSLKHVIYSRNQFLVSTGLSMTAPTADDVRVLNGTGTELVRINNDSVHLMPFLGCFYKPSRQSFLQGFMQVDVDANGNSVLINDNVAQSNLTQVGRLQDLTLLYLDVSSGYWIYRSRGRGLTGVAPLLEGHYNRSLNDADCVIDPSGRTRIQSPVQAYDNFNAVGALVFEFNRRSRLAFGYGVPIGNGSDRAFDNELRITFNRFF